MFINKCDFGYAKKHLIIVLIISIILLGASFGVYFLGIHISGSNKNLLTLVAVLGMLPAGKEIVNLIMCFKAKKYTCDLELYNTILKLTNNELIIRYDMYITSYDNNFPVLALTCFQDSLIGFSPVSKFNHDKFEEHLKPLLSQNGVKVSNIKIFDKESKFLERIESFYKSGEPHTENDIKVIRLMENISL